MTESTRRCGECTLCCRVLPVFEITKPANVKCPQQYSKGCRIYDNRPIACRQWSCAWLVDDSIALPRPDRAHYVIDTKPEYIRMNGITINGNDIGWVCVAALQIWVDPRFPEVHRDPVLRAWLDARWTSHDEVGLVRFDPYNGMTLLPPSLTHSGWIEKPGRATVTRTPSEIAAFLAAKQPSHE